MEREFSDLGSCSMGLFPASKLRNGQKRLILGCMQSELQFVSRPETYEELPDSLCKLECPIIT